MWGAFVGNDCETFGIIGLIIRFEAILVLDVREMRNKNSSQTNYLFYSNCYTSPTESNRFRFTSIVDCVTCVASERV